jgi:hypothetical protein
MTTSRTLPALLIALLALAVALPASAQFKWRDANGRVVYSDQPPPPSVPPSAFLRGPGAGPGPSDAAAAAPARGVAPRGARGDAPAEASTEASADERTAGRAAPLTAADREFEFRKRRLERAEADKKAAEAQARAQRDAAACEESRGEVRTLESGMRVASVDARGERVVSDEADRSRRLESARRAVREFCKG